MDQYQSISCFYKGQNKTSVTKCDGLIRSLVIVIIESFFLSQALIAIPLCPLLLVLALVAKSPWNTEALLKVPMEWQSKLSSGKSSQLSQ